MYYDLICIMLLCYVLVRLHEPGAELPEAHELPEACQELLQAALALPEDQQRVEVRDPLAPSVLADPDEVHEEDVRVGRERADDLDRAPLPLRQVGQDLLEVELQAEGLSK